MWLGTFITELLEMRSVRPRKKAILPENGSWRSDRKVRVAFHLAHASHRPLFLPQLFVRRFPVIILCLFGIAFAGGCSTWSDYFRNGWKVGPNYGPPQVRPASRWIDAGDPALASEPPRNDAWWAVFEDPVLNSLVAAASIQNLDLRTAAWRIVEARAQRRVTVGEIFPQRQPAVGSYSRKEVSQTVKDAVHMNRAFDEWELGGTLAWELDFWGRFRRAIEAADANIDASQENYRSALVLLLAEVASSYVEIRTIDSRLKFLRHNLELQEASLEIARQRFKHGVAPELDVSQALANLAQTEARIPPLATARRQATNALCILLGTLPGEIDAALGGPRPVPSAPPQVAIGIPAALIERRPDVRMAERQLAAQSAKIGIAVSELYPHISITGTIGVAASDFPDLFTSDSFTGSIGPSFRWNILNYGRLHGAIDIEESRFQQLALQYQSAVLKAHREAENALVAFLNCQCRVRSLVRSTAAIDRSVELVKQQYREGLVDFNRVYTLERELTDQQDLLAVATGDVASNLVLVYKALGGGWAVFGEPATYAATQQSLPPQPPPGDNGNAIPTSPSPVPELPPPGPLPMPPAPSPEPIMRPSPVPRISPERLPAPPAAPAGR
jgi:NodT family efflux transporter outer membrane factor (OMF) lipoprotein